MFVSERLNDRHVLDSFDSGREQLDQWLKNDARRAQSSGIAQVYLWREPDSEVVVGYFAITPDNVAPDELSQTVRDGYFSRIPGYLIGRLAIIRELHGSGHLVVVDAIDDNTCVL